MSGSLDVERVADALNTRPERTPAEALDQCSRPVKLNVLRRP